MADYLRLALAIAFVVLGVLVAMFLVYWLTIGFALGLGIVGAFAVVGWLVGTGGSRRSGAPAARGERAEMHLETPPRTDLESGGAGRNDR